MSSSLRRNINNIVTREILDTHTSCIAKVVSYDNTKQLVNVQPLNKYTYINGDVLELPQILEVPVQWPAGGSAIMTFPLSTDDTVIVVFSERSIEEWKIGLSGESIPTPKDPRNHHISDAIAIPCIRTFKQSEALQASSEDVEIRMNANLPNEVKVSLQASGDVLISCPGNVQVEAGSATVNADSTINGDLTVNGDIDATGEVTAKHDTTSVGLSTHSHTTNAEFTPTNDPIPGT